MPEIAHEYAAVNGLRLHCAHAGAGRLMLFLHGFPEFWHCWRRQLEWFGERGWHAVAPDMRGYNLSDKPSDVAQYRAKHLIEDIRGLAAHYGGQKFVLVAHDWGGAVAWAFAAAHPELLSHLVIVNSPHPYTFWRELSTSPAQQKASEYMLLLRDAKAERVLSADGFRRLLAMAFGDAAPGSFGDDDRAAYLEAWSQPGALTGGLSYYRASPLYPPTPADAGAAKLKLEAVDFAVKVPTLVIWGDRDRALLPALLDGLDACVPDLKIVRVPDASHWVVRERPELVNREIDSFVSR